MPKHRFSYNPTNKCSLERFRIVSADEDIGFRRTADDPTGPNIASDAIAFLERMTAHCPRDGSIAVEFVDAPSWRCVAPRLDPARAEAADVAN